MPQGLSTYVFPASPILLTGWNFFHRTSMKVHRVSLPSTLLPPLPGRRYSSPLLHHHCRLTSSLIATSSSNQSRPPPQKSKPGASIFATSQAIGKQTRVHNLVRLLRSLVSAIDLSFLSSHQPPPQPPPQPQPQPSVFGVCSCAVQSSRRQRIQHICTNFIFLDPDIFQVRQY